MNRKQKSLEQLNADKNQAKEVKMVEVSEGVFIEEDNLVNPSDETLLKLAGGDLDMIHTGKKGVELRTILAHRVIIIVILNRTSLHI